MIFYTNLFVRKPHAAVTIGPLIFIRPKYKNDIGLREHEKMHVKQFWRTLGINGLLYFCSATWRYRYELEAYAKQLKYCKNKEYSARLFAVYLSTRYRLRITRKQAYDDLARLSYK